MAKESGTKLEGMEVGQFVSFEAAAVNAGTAVHSAKDDLDRASRILVNAKDKDADPSARQQDLQEVEEALEAAIESGRTAKSAVAGAAAGAKKHKAAREDLGKARTAFSEAARELDQAKQKIEESGSGNKDTRQKKLEEAKEALVTAGNKVYAGLDSLQDALDAIESDQEDTGDLKKD